MRLHSPIKRSLFVSTHLFASVLLLDLIQLTLMFRLQDKGYGEIQANYAVALIYFIGLLLPIFVLIIDYWERRDLWLTANSGILVLGFAIIFITGSFSLLCLCIGLTFALQAVLIPTCVARCLPNSSFKAGMDCLVTITMFGVAGSTILAGAILQVKLEVMALDAFPGKFCVRSNRATCCILANSTGIRFWVEILLFFGVYGNGRW